MPMLLFVAVVQLLAVSRTGGFGIVSTIPSTRQSRGVWPHQPTKPSSTTTTTNPRSLSPRGTAASAQSSSSLSVTALSSSVVLGRLGITSVTAKIVAAATGAVLLGVTAAIKLYLDRPSRTYGDDTVAREYDAWADDGILEYYWGEHIHLGYYSPKELARGYKKKNFIQAKYDFIDQMMAFGNIRPIDYLSVSEGGNRLASSEPFKVLDVGCGFGGTSRYLAKSLGRQAHVTGITLSPKQVERGTQLAEEQGLADQTHFRVLNALNMDFPDNSFDIVWACESGEHMPDKKAYISEMMRVLKPGGKFVMACWSQRDDSVVPFDERDKRDLNYLYEEWTHPFFVSVKAWAKLMEDTGVVYPVKTANWVTQTIASWRHSIWVGIFDPRGWIFKPKTYLKCARDAYCLERMHRAFKRGLMEYGMFATEKKMS